VEWSRSSHKFFHELWKDGKAEEAGITMIPIYRLTTDPQGQEDPCWKDVVFGFKKLSSNEIKLLGDEHDRVYTAGSHFITFCCEPTKFLPYLMKRFLKAGGRFEQKKVVSLDEFDDYDLIVNCTGLCSKNLTNDTQLQPIRGQVARVKAPWIYEAVLHEDDDGNYIIPNTTECILGGTHQVGDYNLKVSPNDSAFIFNGCQKLVKNLKIAETINEKVGLRPGRSEVLLKVEKRLEKPTIIHNTGHGEFL
jgi:D-amino-acid oxidase